MQRIFDFYEMVRRGGFTNSRDQAVCLLLSTLHFFFYSFLPFFPSPPLNTFPLACKYLEENFYRE